MPDNVNREDVTVDLRDVYGQTIHDRVRIRFYNQTAHSLSQEFQVNFNGAPKQLPGVPASPAGLAHVYIEPTKYRYKTIVKNVLSGKPNSIDEDFFVDPSRARPSGIDYADIKSKSFGSELLEILKATKIREQEWNDFDKRIRATIMNLCAKMKREKTANGMNILEQIGSIDRTWLDTKHRERIYAYTSNQLLRNIRKGASVFRAVSGGMHHFPEGWEMVNTPESFKTNDKAGNMQLTFAKNTKEESLVDIDIDDHSGLRHAADVLGHIISGKDTDPYDIHEILLYFQKLDPEYTLV